MANDLKARIAAFKQTREALVKTLKSDLTDILRDEIFNRYPKLTSFNWPQYTPYFNDGDTCTFSTNKNYPSIKYAGRAYGDDCYGEEDDEDVAGEATKEEEDDEDVTGEATKEEQEMDKVIDAIAKVMNLIPDEFFLDMFQDHVRVTATREGFEVEEYDHD